MELCNLGPGYSQKKPETSLVTQKQAQSIVQRTEDLKILRFGIERDTCTPVFTAALFTIARTWKHPRCPLANKWIQKSWYIYTMECSVQFSCSVVSDSSTPWIAARQASLSITNSWSSLRLTSHPLLSPSPLVPNPSQHQSLFQWVNSLHEVAKVLEFKKQGKD